MLQGLQKGDKIIEVNNKKISTWDDFITQIYKNEGNILNINYERDNKISSVKVVPVKNEEENRYVIGISSSIDGKS